jgi:hypothetical protein
MDLDHMLRAYITCALWSTNDESTPQGGEPLDKNYSPDDLAPETRAKMRADCEAFVKSAHADLKEYAGMSRDFWDNVGHDFWLTRNGHGAGFWDGDWPEPQASRLTEASKAMGEVSLYVGDDGRIYQ